MRVRKLVSIGIVAAIIVAVVAAVPASAAVTVTKATGGEAISADTTGGAYTTLNTGMAIDESAKGEIGVGTVILALPAGFEFGPAAINIKVLPASTTLTIGGASCLTPGQNINVVPSASAVTFRVCADSNAGSKITRVEFGPMQVRPSSGVLSSGAITMAPASTSVIDGVVNGTTSFADLAMVAGAFHHVTIAPQNPTIPVGTQQQFTGTARDQYGNPRSDAVTYAATAAAGTISETGLFTGATTAGTYANAVTATSGGQSASTGVTLTAGPRASIAIAPKTATIPAGSSQSYTVEGFDSYGNSRGDETGAATVTGTGDVSCTGSACGTTTAGSYTVTATIGALTDDAWLTVVPASAASIVLSPGTATIAAGASQDYTVEAFDSYGNSRGDVTDDSSLTASAGASCAAAACTSTETGSYTITAAYTPVVATLATESEATLTDTATLEVTPAALHHLTIDPDAAQIAAGGSQSYVVKAYDEYDNLIGDVSDVASLTASAGASCTDATCTSTTAGSYTITAEWDGASVQASLEVVAADLDHLTIDPDAAQIAAGESQSYVVKAYDQYGNLIANVTAEASLSASDGASCTGASCTSNDAGVYTITATYEDASVDATLTVVAGDLAYLTIDPSSSLITAGDSQSYVVNAYDEHDNLIGDVSDDALLTATDGASCTGATCTSQTAGSYTITASLGGQSVDATLDVEAAALHHLILDPADSTITAGEIEMYTAAGYDEFDNLIGDFTAQTTFTISPDGSCTANMCTSEVAGPHTVTGETGTGELGEASGTASLTVVPAAAATITAVLDPSEIIADGSSTTTLTAEVADAFGNLRAGDTVALSTDGDAGVPAQMDADGNGYTATITASTTVGTSSITLTDAGATTSVELTELVGPLSTVVVSAGKTVVRSTVPGLRTDGTDITVLATDAFGNPIIGAPVALDLIAGSGLLGLDALAPSLSEAAGTTDAAGRYRVRYTPGSIPGQDTINALVGAPGEQMSGFVSINVVLCTAPCPMPASSAAARTAAPAAPGPAVTPEAIRPNVPRGM